MRVHFAVRASEELVCTRCFWIEKSDEEIVGHTIVYRELLITAVR
jgi:hypothetical protein